MFGRYQPFFLCNIEPTNANFIGVRKIGLSSSSGTYFEIDQCRFEEWNVNLELDKVLCVLIDNGSNMSSNSSKINT